MKHVSDTGTGLFGLPGLYIPELRSPLAGFTTTPQDQQRGGHTREGYGPGNSAFHTALPVFHAQLLLEITEKGLDAPPGSYQCQDPFHRKLQVCGEKVSKGF